MESNGSSGFSYYEKHELRSYYEKHELRETLNQMPRPASAIRIRAFCNTTVIRLRPVIIPSRFVLFVILLRPVVDSGYFVLFVILVWFAANFRYFVLFVILRYCPFPTLIQNTLTKYCKSNLYI